MVETVYLPYNEAEHREQFYELNVEYLQWIRDEVTKRYGVDYRGRPSVRQYVESALPKFTNSKPPDVIVIILEVDGELAGMGAIRKLEESIAEIKRMYIRPMHRVRGYGSKMLHRLIDLAKDFGYSVLRLDTAEFMTAARHTYESTGFKVRGQYSGTELTDLQPYQIFMEKKQ